MKRLIIDLDGTLTVDDPSTPYVDKEVNWPVVHRLREYRELGYAITIYTSRNMRTYEGEVGKINVHTLPVVLDWLKRKGVPFDEVLVGKPWCGLRGFYVDDRAVRPDEFVRLSPEEISALFRNESGESTR